MTTDTMSYSKTREEKSNKSKKKNSHLTANGDKVEKGAELSSDELFYFDVLSQNIKNARDQHKVLLCENFIDGFTDTNGPRFICNQTASRLLEDVLPFASAASILQVTHVLELDLWTVCTDTFASHVLQFTLILCIKMIQDDYTQPLYDKNEAVQVPLTEEQRTALTNFIIKVSKFCCNNLIDFINDTYASHVLRMLLSVLTGVDLSGMGTTGHHSHSLHALGVHINTLPSSFTELLQYFAQRLMTIPELPNLILEECASAVYQCALHVFKQDHHTSLCLPLVQHLLNNGLLALPEHLDCLINSDDAVADLPPGRSKILAVFNCNPTARLLEVMIECSSAEVLTALFSHLEPCMTQLVQHKVANFTIQRVLEAWRDLESFSAVSDSMEAAAGAALDAHHTGVLLAWAKACRRLNKRQGACVKTLISVLECCSSADEELYIAPCLLHLTPYPQYAQAPHDTKVSLPVTLHGSLILQELLQFRKPIKLVNSILQMSIPQLLRLMHDPKGSYVIDVFCSSQHIGPKSWAALVSKVQSEAIALACSRYGSRSLEAMWAVASIKAKMTMCQRLADNFHLVRTNKFAAILYSKFNVLLFTKNDAADWQEVEQKKSKKRQMLLALKRDNEFEGPPLKKIKTKMDDEC